MTKEHQAESGDAANRFEKLTENLEGAFESRRGFLKKGAAASAAGLGLAAGTGTAAAGDDETTMSEGNTQKYVDALNYALTLERLESTFYSRGLDKFSQSEIEDSELVQQAGEPVQSSVYDRLTAIGKHEAGHVNKIVTTIESLGGDPLSEGAIEFQFPLESPEGFIKTAQTLETTGVSAYDGAIDMFSGSDQLLVAAATIATVEGRHSAYLNQLTGESPFPRAFDEAKPPEEIKEAIQPFIVSN